MDNQKTLVAVYLDDDDRAKLEEVREKTGVSISAQIRTLVRKYLEGAA